MNKKHLFLVLKKGSYHEIDKLPFSTLGMSINAYCVFTSWQI